MVDIGDWEVNEGAAIVAILVTMIAIYSMFFLEAVDWSNIPISYRIIVAVATPPTMYYVALKMIER